MPHVDKGLATQAQALYDERKFADAMVLFEKICDSYPANVNAWVMRGACDQKLGNFEAAVASLRHAVELQPDALDTRLNLANALVTSGNPQEAAEIYQEVLKLKPGSAAVWVLLGKTCLQLNKLEKAKQACREAVRLQPGNIMALMTLGNILQTRGEQHEALECFQEVIRRVPEHGGAYAEAGKVLSRLGQPDAALEAYQKAVEYNPGRQQIHFRLGQLLRERGHVEAAEESFRRAVELKPDDVQALTNLGHLLLAHSKPEEALGMYQQAVLHDSENMQMHVNLGCALRELRREEEAVDSFRKSIRLDSGDVEADRLSSADAHYYMSLALQSLGRLKEAVDSLNEAIKLYPDYVPYILAMAKLQQAMDIYPDALVNFEEVLRIEPENGFAYYGKGSVLYALGRLKEAISSYRQAARFRPNSVRTKVGLAAALMAESRHEEAAECCEDALRIAPGDADAVALAAQIAIRRGEANKAYEYLLPMLERGDLSENVAMAFANVSRDVGRTSEAIQLLQQIVDNGTNQSTESRINLHFSLGRLYDREGEYERAFHHFEQGNRLKHASFGPEHHMLEVDSFIAQNSWYFTNSLPRSTIISERPVFIVGMPRSGTTLVEQILSSHPAVYGAGELTDIGDMADRLPAMLGTQKYFPQCLSEINTEQLDKLATGYLARLEKLSPEAERVTDKMLGFMYLGLIQMVLPSARVIHCKRDPLDTCLSCYFQDFSSAHSYSYDLYNLGVYYRGYQKIMRNWESVLSLPVLEVQYEDMIADQETVSRKLIEFCGLEWDDSCLRFHENERFVGTASYDQVRRPIYSSSVSRWKNYEEFIGPLREALDLYQEQG